MIITITGWPGSGNSSLARMLAKKLGYKHYSGGDMRRKLANERGISLPELNKIGEKESWTDIEVDNFLKELGKKEDNVVLDAKIGNYLIPHSFKIFLIADLDVRAKRVFLAKRHEEMFNTIEKVKKALDERVRSDKKRYKKYYEIETYTGKGFDLVIDTTNLNLDTLLETVLKKVSEHKNKNIRKA